VLLSFDRLVRATVYSLGGWLLSQTITERGGQKLSREVFGLVRLAPTRHLLQFGLLLGAVGSAVVLAGGSSLAVVSLGLV